MNPTDDKKSSTGWVAVIVLFFGALLVLYMLAIVDMAKSNQRVEKTCPPHLVERHIVSVKPYITKTTCRQPGVRKP